MNASVGVSELPSTSPPTWIFTSLDINSWNKSLTSSINALRFSSKSTRLVSIGWRKCVWSITDFTIFSDTYVSTQVLPTPGFYSDPPAVQPVESINCSTSGSSLSPLQYEWPAVHKASLVPSPISITRMDSERISNHSSKTIPSTTGTNGNILLLSIQFLW